MRTHLIIPLHRQTQRLRNQSLQLYRNSISAITQSMRLLERVLHSKTKDQLVLVSLGKPKRTNPNFFLIEELFGFVFFILNSIQARLGVFTPRLACAYADLSAAYVFIMFFLPFFKFSFAFFAFKEGLDIREEASCECFQFVFQSESRNGLHLLSRLFFYSLPFLSLSGNSATSFNTESLLSPYSMLFSKVLLSAEGKTTIGDQNSTIILLTSRFLVVIAGNAGLSRGAICLLSYNIQKRDFASIRPYIHPQVHSVINSVFKIIIK